MKHRPLVLVLLTCVVLAAIALLGLAQAQKPDAAGVARPSAKLSWSPGEVKPGIVVASWNIYRAPEIVGPYTLVGNVPAATTSYTDFTIGFGGRYFYRVTAMSADGVESAPSKPVEAVVAQPAAPLEPPSDAISLWPENQRPSGSVAKEKENVELGLRFTSDVAGAIAGLRFYKSKQNDGPHTGSLWSATGKMLATGTFGKETGSGWQILLFPTPVPIQPGAVYVVSYHTQAGRYAFAKDYFTSPRDAPPLHAPVNAGVFMYGGGGFPSQAFQGMNYWIDPIFVPSH